MFPLRLNLGIKHSSGDPIIRLDAHTRYSSDYFEKILETFDQTGADIIGGPMNAVGETNFQKAVAHVTSTWFGIGNSKLHDVNFTGYSDHVYLGAWKRKLFDEIGLFDEKLIRNQDDEFHYRAKSMGKKIFLNAEIKSYYFPRSTFKSLVRQYFQYGEYKPIVMNKIKTEIKLRHIIPAFFVAYLMTIPFWLKFPILIYPFSIYFVIDVWFSFKNRYNYKIKLISFMIYPLIHIAYGSGTIIGIKNLFNKTINTKKV
jgi:succinoglycan biosynthesis protein ExoA